MRLMDEIKTGLDKRRDAFVDGRDYSLPRAPFNFPVSDRPAARSGVDYNRQIIINLVAAMSVSNEEFRRQWSIRGVGMAIDSNYEHILNCFRHWFLTPAIEELKKQL